MKNSLTYSFDGSTGDLLNRKGMTGVAESFTYDVWGTQTVTMSVAGIRRGFTGHEHWNEFGLIDMNFASKREQTECFALRMPSVSKMDEFPH